MNVVNKKSLLATALCLTLTSPVFAGVKASASDNRGTERVTVTYVDLDISQADGMAVLQKRLKKAAEKVCHVNDFAFSLVAKAGRQECFDETLQKATEQIGNTNAITMISN